MDLEGELCVRLRVSAGRIAQIHVDSTRPDVALALLQGRSVAEVEAAVPLLFSICGRSQTAASRLACAAAAGAQLESAALAECAAAVTSELVRECAWRALLDWPVWIGEKPGDDALAAARGSATWHAEAPGEPGERAVAARICDRIARDIGLAVFGGGADEWLALRSLGELDGWADAGKTAAARFIRRVRDDDAAAMFGDRPARPAAHTPLLDSRDHATWIVELSDACDADPGFARSPTWRGAPAESGALARRQADPLIADLLRRSASRIPARFVARLRELASLLSGTATASVGVKALASGAGIAWVENARGLLIHQVRLKHGSVERYRIVAPTEWNFHPAGALAAALLGAPAHDLTAIKQGARRLVHSLDPCVACRIEIDDA